MTKVRIKKIRNNAFEEKNFNGKKNSLLISRYVEMRETDNFEQKFSIKVISTKADKIN